MAWNTIGFPRLSENIPNALTVWDSPSALPPHLRNAYTWNGYAESNSVRSVLRYAETHGDRLRSKYLEWIHDLGESRIGGRRLIDHLAFEDGLSYWWMTLLVEQSPWKSPAIIDAIRLLAFEEIVVRDRPAKIRLVSGNRILHATIRDVCNKLSVAYEWERRPDTITRKAISAVLVAAMPAPLKAVGGLIREVFRRWPLRRLHKQGWFAGNASIFLCSYFFNVDRGEAAKGRFHSRYWDALHAFFQKNQLRANWLQLYYPHDATPDARSAIDLARRFNDKRQEQGFHVFVDSYLSIRIVVRVVRRWFGLNVTYWKLKGIWRSFRVHDSQVSFWPLMRADWKASMCGPTAVKNLLWKELFDEALRDLPFQKKGLYLCENQGWERAMVHAWRKHGHGRLIGVVHSTVRFWDLRYFTDPRTLQSSDPHPIPRADLFALNGRAAVEAFRDAGYSKEATVECEALRFGHLDRGASPRSIDRSNGKAIKVLILGDYFQSESAKMLQLLEAAAPCIGNGATYTVKPHPNCRIRPEDYPTLRFEVVTDSLEEILRDFDVVYCSNLTSAAVDAYFAGLPVVVMLDDTRLNFSPLRGEPAARFVSTREELAEALVAATQSGDKPNSHDYFFLDPQLPKWGALLLK